MKMPDIEMIKEIAEQLDMGMLRFIIMLTESLCLIPIP